MAIRKSSSSPGASHRVPSRSAPLDGRLAVEFANTAHPSAGNQDPLRSWEGLLAFLSGTGVISSDRFRNLLEWEHASAPAIQQLLQAAVRLRTADRKSTRLNSSHRTISYAVFCLKKKKRNKNDIVL